MEQPISAAEANRQFPSLLKSVREGKSYVVTSHGKPVARIIPADHHEANLSSARDSLIKRLAQQPVIDIGGWSRDEICED